DPVHPRPQRGARAEEALAPARGRGPEPRDRPLGPRRADGARRRRMRRGRPHHRGAPPARRGAVRRPPVAQAEGVRRADEGAAPGRRGGGPVALRAAGLAGPGIIVAMRAALLRLWEDRSRRAMALGVAGSVLLHVLLISLAFVPGLFIGQPAYV